MAATDSAPSRRSSSLSAIKLALCILAVARYLLYMMLMMVRTPVRLACNFLAYPLMALGILWGLMLGWRSAAFLLMFGAGVGLYVLAFVFDSLLLWVSPERLFLEE